MVRPPRTVIGVVWESLHYVCAQPLKPVLLPTARHLAGFDELRLTSEIEMQLATISRPYHKNDTGFVEQKNDTRVRAYLSHRRLDTQEECEAVNALYDKMWMYYDLFQPVLHLIGKEVVENRIKRKWDDAQNPFQRVLATKVLQSEQEAKLRTLYAQTNPRQLRREIYWAIGRLWDDPKEASWPS